MRYQEESQRVRIQQEKEKIELINNTAFTVKAHVCIIDDIYIFPSICNMNTI
jgi:hypothetical protein